MRKLFYAAILLATTSLIFIACTKEDATIQSQTETSKVSQNGLNSRMYASVIDLTDYGFYHNEGLSLYYTSQNGICDTISSVIVDKITNKLKAKYPKGFSDVNIEELKSAFKDSNLKQFDMISFWNSKKEELYNSGKLSRRIGKLVDNILISNMTYDQYMHEIQNFKNSNNLDLKEQNSLIVFESVLQGSNEFWNSDNNAIYRRAKPGSKTIFADGMGALMFCYSGPGSIIAGCICSLFVNETQEP